MRIVGGTGEFVEIGSSVLLVGARPVLILLEFLEEIGFHHFVDSGVLVLGEIFTPLY